MDSKPTLKERMDAASHQADLELERMKGGSLSKEDFRAAVRGFTLSKFLLDEEECDTDDIFALAELSIEKLLRENDKSVKLAQGSNTCTNQSSTDIKKVLLSLTLQRGLGVHFTPAESADLETTQQLADALREAMPAGGSGQGE